MTPNFSTRSHRLIVVAAALLATIGSVLAQPTPTQTAPTPPPRSAESSTADALFQKQDWENAAKAYEALTRSEPKNPEAWFRLGYVLHAKGDLAAAIDAHRKAAEFPRIRAQAMYNLCCALALQGKTDEAFVALDGAIQAGFRNLRQYEGDSDLALLRADPRDTLVRRRIQPLAELVKEFDFWVGHWEVVDDQGIKIGENRIEKAEGGMIVMEHWTSVRGTTGRSMNYIDPVLREWKQLWVDDAGNVVRYTGVVRDGAMHFEGEYLPQRGPRAIARGRLTPRNDGTVHHFIEHSTDNGASWEPYFDGVYSRAATTDAPKAP
ncbi:MAG TPA: hypothetical protein DEB06_01225 [Phycisphaerales bacterium]|nr:hypothetical protein [Phycisphaerales bacterium]